MNWTKRAIIVGTLALAFGAAAAARAELKFGVAAEPYPPFASKDASGKWAGWEIDAMDALCQEMKEKCAVIEIAWDGIIPALTSKQIDVIFASMGGTEERRKTIDFSDMYYATSPAFIGAKTGDLDVSPEHLKGKTIGVQVSTVNQAYVDKYHGKTASIKVYQTQDEATQDLAAGRVDYVMADTVALDVFLKSKEGLACCEFKALVTDDQELIGDGSAMAGLRKEDTAVRDKLNAAIKALAANGTFEAITKKNGLEGKLLLPKP